MDDQNQNPQNQPPQPSQPANSPPSAEHSTQQLPHQPGLVLQPSQPSNQEILPQNNTNSRTPVTTQQSPTIPNPAVYTEPPQTSGNEHFSRNDFEKEDKKKRKKKKLLIISVVLFVIILGGAGSFYYWYSKQDHSVYSKLSTENYNSSTYNVSFKYPTVMQKNPQALSKLESSANYGPLVAYLYQNSNNQKAIELASFLNVSTLLNQLGLTPTQATNQIISKSGSYIDLLNHANPNAFSTLYPNCDSTIQNINGQTNIICTVHNNITRTTYISTLIVGLTQDTQYTLTLEMPNSLWLSHSKVWNEVEKSFTYQ